MPHSVGKKLNAALPTAETSYRYSDSDICPLVMTMVQRPKSGHDGHIQVFDALPSKDKGVQPLQDFFTETFVTNKL